MPGDDYMDREVRSAAGLKYVNRQKAHNQATQLMEAKEIYKYTPASKPAPVKRAGAKRGSKR